MSMLPWWTQPDPVLQLGLSLSSSHFSAQDLSLHSQHPSALRPELQTQTLWVCEYSGVNTAVSVLRLPV